jgi:hypothetical protein
VRFAKKHDVAVVMKYIADWKNGHILSHDQELFEYMYLGNDDDINFVIAPEISTGRVVAILGFIPTNTSRSRVSIALWKSVNDKNQRALQPGLACFRFLNGELSPESLFCVGINASTRVIYEFMGYSTGLMNHHFVVNNSLADFKIIMNPPNAARSESNLKTENYFINRIGNSSYLTIAAADLKIETFGKDADYLCRRYLDHPIFKYEIIEVMEKSKIIGILIYRRCFVEESSCLRIIDVIGGAYCLKGAKQYLIDEMMKSGDEYIDLVSWGLDKTDLENIGFADRRDHIDCIVPEHFSPFSRINRDIWFFSNLPDSEQFFKGDGDLDRPN